jgi:methionyl-tRNA formyltransferase
MKIIFFGSPAPALPTLEKILEAGHKIELVITQPDKPAGRGKTQAAPPVKEFALKHSLPVLQPVKIRQDESVLETIKKINPDINVVVAYGQMIPASIIFLPRLRSLNVHFSLLPKYRGAAPVQWAILRGEKKTGVTIFELNEKMDEGEILTSQEIDVLERENAWQLETRLAQIGAILLIRTLEGIEGIRHSPQDHSQASYAPRLKKEQGRIDWTNDASAVERMVRAFNPWPAAYTFFKGQRLIIHAGRRLSDSGTGGHPGQVLAIKKEGIAIICGSGSVFLAERLQRENKKALEAAEFVRGIKIEPGDMFE